MKPNLTHQGRLWLKVKPNMPKTCIIAYDPSHDLHLMHVHAKPIHGAANEEMLRHLRKKFGWDAKIISGKASSKKRIKVTAQDRKK